MHWSGFKTTHIRGKKAEGDSLPNAANQNNSLLDFADSGSDLFFFLPLSRLHVSSVPDLLCTVTLDVLVSFKLQQIQPRQIWSDLHQHLMYNSNQECVKVWVSCLCRSNGSYCEHYYKYISFSILKVELWIDREFLAPLHLLLKQLFLILCYL